MSIDAVDIVCRLVGSQDKLAAILKIRSASISGWRRRGRVPAERCAAIEAATGGRVTRYQLRPDIFGDAPPRELQEAS